MPAHRRSRTALLALTAVLVSLAASLLVAVPTGSAAATRLVVGVVNFPQRDRPKVQLVWFDSNWRYLGKKSAVGGTYALSLPPGRYHLQFVDRRPAYDIRKYAPTDVTVTVGRRDVTRNVTMRRGGYLTGTVRTGDGRPAANARVVAANRAQNSFETTANAQGQFAIGGLPHGQYSIFTWDRRKRWVTKSAWAGTIKPRRGKDMRIRLGQRAGSLRVLLRTPDGRLRGRGTVTVTSTVTGQWWTATARGGSVAFDGLHPGRYRLQFGGAGSWLPSSGPVRGGTVRPSKGAIGIFTATKRGAAVTGRVVDVGVGAEKEHPKPLAGVTVLAYDAAGRQLGRATTTASGRYLVTGQITTQTLTLIVQPGGPNPPYLEGLNYCKFGRATRSVAVTAPRTTALPDLVLPRLPAAQQDDPVKCSGVTPPPKPTASPTATPTTTPTTTPTATPAATPTATPAATPTTTPAATPTASGR